MSKDLTALVRSTAKVIAKAPEDVTAALDEWLSLLQGPANPPFAKGTSFRGEWKRFFRLVAISIVMSAAALGVDHYLPGSLAEAPKIPAKLVYLVIAGFGFAAVFYHLFAKPFGIKITPRQAFFCMGFVLIPWMPILAAVKFVSARIGFVFLLITSYSLLFYIPILLARGIQIVADTTLLRAILSLVLLALIILASVGSFVAYSVSSANG